MSIDPKKYIDIDTQDTPIIIYRDKGAITVPLDVIPSSEAQTFVPEGDVDGFAPVNVSAVTSSVDSNIRSENIKEGVSILGVDGSYEGIVPTGTKQITSNGTYDVSSYASADVSVSQSKYGLSFDAWVGDVSQSGYPVTTGGSGTPNFVGVRNIPMYWLANRFIDNKNIVGVANFSSLESVTGQMAAFYAFMRTGLTGVNMHNLRSISAEWSVGYMFYGCEDLESFDLSSLETISGSYSCGYMFGGCPNLTTADLSSLTAITGVSACSNMFKDCTGLTNVNLSSLSTLTGYYGCREMFLGCTSLRTLSFSALSNLGSYTNQFDDMLSGCSNVMVHFPSALQSVIGSWTSVQNGFSGTNTTVLFDL